MDRLSGDTRLAGAEGATYEKEAVYYGTCCFSYESLRQQDGEDIGQIFLR